MSRHEPPPLRSSEPTLSAKRVPAWVHSSGGRGCDLTRANRGAFGKTEQVAVGASETAVRGAQEQRRSARNGNRRGTEKVGVQLQEVWRRHHGVAAIESAGEQSFRSDAVLCRDFRQALTGHFR